MVPRGLILAAPSSGAGKTTLTLALLRRLRSTGVAVGSFKIGPDFIDPSFHAVASGGPCRTLDPWGMRPRTRAAVMAATGRDADLVLGEGMMGLFDGAVGERGSTADVAAALDLPVVLVVDVGGQAASAGALVRGFASHRDDVRIAGVVFNRVGSAAHAATLCDAMVPLGVPVFGSVPWSAALSLPERHLGLVPAAENLELDRFLDEAAALVAAHVDIAALRHIATPLAAGRWSDDAGPDGPGDMDGSARIPVPPPGQRIAVARDTAFCFVYEHVLDGWRAAGAEVAPFSPLAGDTPSTDADAVFLPGGYPELHAGTIAANRPFLEGLRHAAARGAAVYGECGGYMVLGQGLVDARGHRHAMAGLLAVETSFAQPRVYIGYRTLTLLAGSPLAARGATFTGHEFHFSSIVGPERAAGDRALFVAASADGQAIGDLGAVRGRVCGSFAHLIDRAPTEHGPPAGRGGRILP
jgi:cobyrinic acid a,c-diamide synthase